MAEVPDVGAATLGGFLLEVAARFGPNEAVVLDDPLLGGRTVRWTYERLAVETQRVGAGLMAAGVQRGDAVAVIMTDYDEAAAAA